MRVRVNFAIWLILLVVASQPAAMAANAGTHADSSCVEKVWVVACSGPHYKNAHLEGPQGREFSRAGRVWGVACSTLHYKNVHLEGPQGRVSSIDGTVWGVACSTLHFKNVHLEGPQGRESSSDGTVWGVACSTLHVKNIHLEGPQGRESSSDGGAWGVASSAPRIKGPVLAAPRGHESSGASAGARAVYRNGAGARARARWSLRASARARAIYRDGAGAGARACQNCNSISPFWWLFVYAVGVAMCVCKAVIKVATSLEALQLPGIGTQRHAEQAARRRLRRQGHRRGCRRRRWQKLGACRAIYRKGLTSSWHRKGAWWCPGSIGAPMSGKIAPLGCTLAAAAATLVLAVSKSWWESGGGVPPSFLQNKTLAQSGGRCCS